MLLRDGLNEFVFATETLPPRRHAPRRLCDWRHWRRFAGGHRRNRRGFDAGRFGEIFVAGKNVIESKRGYHLVAINPQTGAVEQVASFDTFADADESARLAQFIAELPRRRNRRGCRD